jgi:hypothetical protein
MQTVTSVVELGEPKSAFPTTPPLRHFQLRTFPSPGSDERAQRGTAA